MKMCLRQRRSEREKEIKRKREYDRDNKIETV
jgi:hypothetical protein